MAGTLSAAGCLGPQGPDVSVRIVDDVYRLDEPLAEAESAGSDEAIEDQPTLAGAIDETLSFCMVIAARDGVIGPLTAVPGVLRSGDAMIPPNAMRLYRVHDVRVDHWPGWHVRSIPPQDRPSRIGDVLVPVAAPRGGLPAMLAEGESLVLWVDLRIPKGTAPGTYFGQMELRQADRILRIIPLSVTVWPFVLPAPHGVALLADVDHQQLFAHHVRVDGRHHAPARLWGDTPAGAELDDVLFAAARLLHDHGVTPLLSKLTPIVKIEATGRPTVDWQDYNRVVAGLLDGTRFFDRQPLPWWSVPFNEEFPPPPEYGALASPTYSNLAREYLAECSRYFAEQGWLDRSFVVVPGVTGPSAEGYAAARHFGRIVRNADPRLRMLVPLFPQDMAAYGWEGFTGEDVADCVSIWSPKAQFFDRQEMEQQRIEGKRTFWTLDRPPFSGSIELAAPPDDTRVVAWQAGRYGVEAVRLGLANDWPADVTDPSPQQCCTNHEAPLIYPGRWFGLSQPVPSARLKRLHRSMMDLAYTELLEQQGLGHIAALLSESLCRASGADAYGAHFADGDVRGAVVRPGTGSPDAYALARRIMADEIAGSLQNRVARGTATDLAGKGLGGETSSAGMGQSRPFTERVANSVQWRRFMEATRRLDIKVEGVRVRAVGPSTTGVMEIAVSVALTNGTRSPVSGSLGFGELPIGWQAEAPEVELAPIGPLETRRVTLRATAGVIETDENGVRYLPLILRITDPASPGASGWTQRFSARLCYVAATAPPRPIRVDGDLSDWPSQVGSSAGDFVLLSGEDARAIRDPADRAAQQTQCFVLCDGTDLYLALNCPIDSASGLPAEQRNFVRYEDGVPVGEELAEILLDPTNAGTRSPADLFHVVLKPYGWFCERGIAADPPVGAHHPWASGLQTAVKIHDDRWVAEVRIPLDAFGQHRQGRQAWGLNVTRFDLPRQESSNWSGAAQNVYDPLSLGNVALP